LRYAGDQPLTQIPEEESELRYIPLGVGAVIPPWNFACAIMVGLTSSALVAGNTVVLKPASTAALVAVRFVELLEQAGVPAGRGDFLPRPRRGGGGGPAGPSPPPPFSSPPPPPRGRTPHQPAPPPPPPR